MSNEFLFKPIGIIRTSMRLKFDAPSQPEDDGKRNTVELIPGTGYEAAVQDLEGFDRIWLLWGFHRNKGWRPQVLPPRGTERRIGLFATRSPHRPNPIGLTCTRLYGVTGLQLTVGSVDLLDETPIFDIKPYIPAIDAFPGSKTGWLAEAEAADAAPPAYSISVSELCRTQLEWLKAEWNVEFFDRASRILARSPSPHRTKRITRYHGGKFRIGCGAWKLIFSICGETVLVEEVKRGYPRRLLLAENYGEVPDRDAQLAFEERWPDLRDAVPLGS